MSSLTPSGAELKKASKFYTEHQQEYLKMFPPGEVAEEEEEGDSETDSEAE